MKTEKLPGVDAFVVFDLETAERSVGITRLAPKVLVDGATWLARTETYRYASFGRKVGGASAGINAKEGRDEAIAGFVAEVEPWVRDGRFLTLPGKGIGVDDFAALRAVDHRLDMAWSDGSAVTAAGVVAAAAAACPGGLEGRTVAIEALDVAGPDLVAQLVAAGASITAVSVGQGAGGRADGSGFTAEQLAADARDDLDLGEPAGAVFAAPVDVLLVGSKAGVLDHRVAATVEADVVAPYGAIPVTAKALAVLGRSGTQVLPDFVTTAGGLFIEADASLAGATSSAVEAITAEIAAVVDAEDGPLLAACRRAEAFLASWVDDMPFGRPIA